jgi:putative transposase
MVRAWKQALVIVQAETLLHWHRQGFRLFWRQKSKATSTQMKVSAETIVLIKEMAKNNRRLVSGTDPGRVTETGYSRLQTNDSEVHAGRAYASPNGAVNVKGILSHPLKQNWRTFLRNHRGEIWACDFLQVTDLFFRPLFAFFIIELRSRKVIHVGVTRSPTDV